MLTLEGWRLKFDCEMQVGLTYAAVIGSTSKMTGIVLELFSMRKQ